ncbi:unnamed protein product [Leptidea sinapis]|uniref:Transcriptional adapter n=1 Tax=Leptidea sinapis TaxID=189913 RepID=A0A5E4QV38_9NEOP|nr:unnamed protein product [Leptidea sinapis]
MSFSDLYAKYNCTYCQEEINGVRVRCAECKDFDICLQCFSLGAEIGQHRNDHSYQFMDAGAFGIFLGRNSWTANEEVRLLDAMEQFGFGNWEDIAKHIETRTSEEARDEYIARYFEGSIGRATWGNVETASRPLLHCPEKDNGPLSPSAVSRLQPLAITQDEAAQLCYMSNRDDFERRLRWTAQFYGRGEQAAAVGGLWRERELRVRLAELHRYRLAGVARLEECAHYDQHASHRRHSHDLALALRRRKRLKFHKPKVHTGRKHRLWLLQKELLQQRQRRAAEAAAQL